MEIFNAFYLLLMMMLLMWSVMCAVKRVYRKLPGGPNDFTLTRGCADVCKEDDSTQCCLTNYCNGARVSASNTSASLHVLLSVLVFLCLYTCLYVWWCLQLFLVQVGTGIRVSVTRINTCTRVPVSQSNQSTRLRCTTWTKRANYAHFTQPGRVL